MKPRYVLCVSLVKVHKTLRSNGGRNIRSPRDLADTVLITDCVITDQV
jgi:hypothetical protein